MYAVHRNATKKLKRRDNTINAQFKEKDELICDLQLKSNSSDDQVSHLKGDKDRLRHKLTYWKKKFTQLKMSVDERADELLVEHEQVQGDLMEKICELENDNSELHELVDDLMSSTSEISTFAHGKYTDDIRLCCYELLSLNVGINNIKPVITSVLKNIAQKTVSRLPSKALLCNMMVESLTLAQAQLAEELSSDFFTLQTDGTTKYGQHFATYDICTDDTLGLRHIFSGSSQTTLKEILDDLDSVCAELGGSDERISSRIIAKMKNTMSDRHSAEKRFNELLFDYRTQVLPEVVEGWDNLVETEKDQITRMNNFYCGLHYLVLMLVKPHF